MLSRCYSAGLAIPAPSTATAVKVSATTTAPAGRHRLPTLAPAGAVIRMRLGSAASPRWPGATGTSAPSCRSTAAFAEQAGDLGVFLGVDPPDHVAHAEAGGGGGEQQLAAAANSNGASSLRASGVQNLSWLSG